MLGATIIALLGTITMRKRRRA
ncbi:hypothetical protein [Lacticaseibacillus camelliae]